MSPSMVSECRGPPGCPCHHIRDHRGVPRTKCQGHLSSLCCQGLSLRHALQAEGKHEVVMQLPSAFERLLAHGLAQYHGLQSHGRDGGGAGGDGARLTVVRGVPHSGLHHWGSQPTGLLSWRTVGHCSGWLKPCFKFIPACLLLVTCSCAVLGGHLQSIAPVQLGRRHVLAELAPVTATFLLRIV